MSAKTKLSSKRLRANDERFGDYKRNRFLGESKIIDQRTDTNFIKAELHFEAGCRLSTVPAK